MRGNAQSDGRPLGGPIFRCFWSVRSLQRRFPVDVRRYSRSSREVVRNRAEILMFLGRQFSTGKGHLNL